MAAGQRSMTVPSTGVPAPGAAPSQAGAQRTRPSPGEWVCLALGLGLLLRYRWIFDDSYVYFRYVDNLLFLKAGLVFNAGEYVEGFSSPLHCLILIGLRSLHLTYPVLILLLGCACFVLFWWLLVQLNRALIPNQRDGQESRPALHALNFPLIYLAANYSLCSFFSAGNEAPLVHVMAAAYALLLVRPSSRLALLLVALSPLARPELALSLVLLVLWQWASTRRFPRLLASLALLFNAAWLSFRVIYYADLLPNTYYLKTGTSLERGSNLQAGMRYLEEAVRPYGLPFILGIFAAFAIALILSLRGPLRFAPRAGMLLMAASVGAFVVASGGSGMHYYYLAFPLTLSVCALGGLLEGLLAESRLALTPARALALTLVLAAGFASRYPSTLSEHPIGRKEHMNQLPSELVLTDPSFFRHRVEPAGQWPSIQELKEYAPVLAEQGYQQWTDIIWCHSLYANYQVGSIHAYGLTDALLARVQTPEFRRGHKPALGALARDLIQLQIDGQGPAPGLYTRAIAEGRAPAWMRANRQTIELLERKITNRHGLWENLRLAFSFPAPIRL